MKGVGCDGCKEYVGGDVSGLDREPELGTGSSASHFTL